MKRIYNRPRTAWYCNFLKDDNHKRVKSIKEDKESKERHITTGKKQKKNATTNIGKVILGYVYWKGIPYSSNKFISFEMSKITILYNMITLKSRIKIQILVVVVDKEHREDFGGEWI